MDCRFFSGNLTREDREFLVKLLKRFDARLMLTSWLEGKVKIPSGKTVDPEKAKAVKILRCSRGLCGKERVSVFAVEQGCVFWQPKKT
jgi:hypothetical protein